MEAHHLSHLIHLIIAGQEQTLGCADSEILQKGGEIYPGFPAEDTAQIFRCDTAPLCGFRQSDIPLVIAADKNRSH